jgi:hypothetical protein
MLYKAVAIILSALFIAVVQISTASAGGCHGGFGHGFGRVALYQSSPSQSYALKQARARRAAEARAAAAARQKAAQVARAEKKAEAAKVADAEPAKTDTKEVASDTTKTPENELKVASADQTCTKFIAEVGTTVTTDCASK